jgi:hypothetical protein
LSIHASAFRICGCLSPEPQTKGRQNAVLDDDDPGERVGGLIELPASANAQSADELAKQTQNPVASLITVPLQGNWDFGRGDREATGTQLNIQPVMPFAVSSRTNVSAALLP